MRTVFAFRLVFAALLLGFCLPAEAASLRVATASNFSEAMNALSAEFKRETGHNVVSSFASTGTHYAQIHNGAPFDLFFAADARRPRMLEEEGRAVPGTRFTYALGKLLLWSATPGYVPADGDIASLEFRFIAIANPRLAPYGQAARQALVCMGLWETVQDRLVQGENISQTLQFLRSGNAELGFIAAAQLEALGMNNAAQGSVWTVPATCHDPIEQQAILLRESEAAREFIRFVQGEKAAAIIRTLGYELP